MANPSRIDTEIERRRSVVRLYQIDFTEEEQEEFQAQLVDEFLITNTELMIRATCRVVRSRFPGKPPVRD